MKEPLNRTKLVIRHLPPTLSHDSFFDQIDSRFSFRYNWSSFRPGKSSYKNQKHGRAYINFNRPEDVFEFAEFFGGHVFVNEKGTQFKAIVEYAPSQRVPKPIAKKDGREGTIYKDPEYVDFLERVSKPVENLPSADIQMERREAERSGVLETPIVTPLMEFIRKRRAAKSGNQTVGRSRLASPGKSRSSKQISEKTKYILKANGKSSNGKDKPAYNLASQRENHLDASNKIESLDNDNGSISHDTTKKRILILKGKSQEISQSKAGSTTPEAPSLAPKRHDASGKIIKSILLNKQSQQSQSSSLEQKLPSLYLDKGNRPPRPYGSRPSRSSSTSDQSPLSSDNVRKKSGDEISSGKEPNGAGRDRQDRRTRSRERHDRGVWTPLLRSDSSHSGDGFQSNVVDSFEGKHGDSKYATLQSGRGAEIQASAANRHSSYTENGSHRQFGRHGATHSGKDDVSSKRGGIISHGVQEKRRVWVQKSAAGS